MKKIILFSKLKTPTNLILLVGVILILFNLNYWIMANTLGTGENKLQCVEGGSFTNENIIFSILMSFFMGIFLIGLKELFLSKKSFSKSISGFSIFSFTGILGFFTIFCPVCTIGVISIFGISFGLNFFLDYNFFIKIISLLFLLFGLYWINGQLKEDCKICKFMAKK